MSLNSPLQLWIECLQNTGLPKEPTKPSASKADQFCQSEGFCSEWRLHVGMRVNALGVGVGMGCIRLSPFLHISLEMANSFKYCCCWTESHLLASACMMCWWLWSQIEWRAGTFYGVGDLVSSPLVLSSPLCLLFLHWIHQFDRAITQRWGRRQIKWKKVKGIRPSGRHVGVKEIKWEWFSLCTFLSIMGQMVVRGMKEKKHYLIHNRKSLNQQAQYHWWWWNESVPIPVFGSYMAMAQ